MNIDKIEHRKMMLKVLESVSKNSLLANNLGFKGGTACYFLHGLDRFSVDLDFDLLDKRKEKIIKKTLLKMLGQFGTVKTKTSIKLIYNNKLQALKIDLSNRYDNNRFNAYEIKDIVSGLPLKVLQKEDIFAHKLIALTDRSSSSVGKDKFIANRDLYDIHFFFKHNWKFNEKIIEKLSGKNTREYLREVFDFIEKYSNEKNILARLGELLSDEKRKWVKENLKREILTQLAIEIKARE